MKPNLKIICSTLIILITIFFLTIYVTTHISDFKTLSNIGLSNFYFIFLIFIFNITFIILNGLYLDILMKPFGLKLKQRESFGLSVVTNFYNTITPFNLQLFSLWIVSFLFSPPIISILGVLYLPE